MMGENKRRYERVETNVKVMLSGDAAWTECSSCNVSGGGLFFESARQQKIGDLVTLQFMLQAKTRTMSNVHFIVSAKVIRVTPQSNGFQVAVEFILNKDLREEILKVVKIIQSQNLEVERPTIREKLFRRVKLE
jgi:hypothetical protein